MLSVSPVKRPIPNMIRLFKRRLVSQNELDTILLNLPAKDRNLGALPLEWFPKDLPKSQYAAFSQKIFGIFGSFAKRVKSGENAPIYSFISPMTELERKLKKVFGRDTRTEFLERGCAGKAFKLFLCGKRYVIKVFHLGKRVENRGKTQEIANAVNYCHATRKKKHAQFHFGRIAGKRNYDGFIVKEFLSGKIVEVHHIGPRIGYRRFTLVDAMDGKNHINGKLFDFDDIEKTYSSKKAEKIAKQLIETLERGDYQGAKKLLARYKGLPEKDEVISKIMESAPIDSAICKRRNIDIDTDYTPEQVKILKMFEKE